MKKIFLLFAGVFILLFAGCSSKEVFEPKFVKDDWAYQGSRDEKIVDVSSDVAMLENRQVLLKDKTINTTIEESYRLLGSSDGWVLSSTIDGELNIDFIGDKSMKKKFNLKKTIAGASIKDDILAVLFADNEMALYSISKNELLVKVQGTSPVVVDSKIFFVTILKIIITRKIYASR